jgi:dihydroxyacid dehydratase/phosphogluconate dehydratase
MKTMAQHLSGEALTVTGEPNSTYFENEIVKESQVIHPLESPRRKTGGLAIMTGNLATGGSVLRVSGVPSSMMQFRGKAKVFTEEFDAIKYLNGKEIKDPTVLVVKNQGLIGGPCIKGLLPLAGEIVGRNLEERVALTTDARLSGGAIGLSFGLVSPESALGGGLALVKDNDFIRFDVPNRSMQLEMTDDEFDCRKKALPPYVPKTTSAALEKA